MPDLFAPDPEHHAPAAPAKAEKPPPPAWVSGCKSGLLTVLAFLFLLAMTVVMIVGFVGLGRGLHQVNQKLDNIQKRLDGLDGKPGDKKLMPPAD